jgi:hypothetical protein
VEFVNALYRSSPTIELPAGDIQDRREKRREQLDEYDRKLPASPDEAKKIRYSDDLDDALKIEIAVNSLDLLGQILRNFPGSLQAGAKVEIAKCTYLLGLRMTAAILDFISKGVAQYREEFSSALEPKIIGLEAPDPSKDSSESKDVTASIEERMVKLRQTVDDLFLLLTRLAVAGSITKISASVGSPELEQTYSDVLATLPDSNAIHLIDLALQLAHAPGFPESKIKQLHQRMDKNSFAHQTLADLVVGHLLFFEVDFRTLQRTAALLNFKIQPRLLEQRMKLLKPKATTRKRRQ